MTKKAPTRLRSAEDASEAASLLEFDILARGKIAALDRLTLLAADICSAESASLTLFDGVTGHVVSSTLSDTGEAPRETTFCGVALARREELLVADALSDPRFVANPHVLGAPHVRSYFGIPVGPADLVPVGVLCVMHHEPNRFGAAEMARLRQVAGLVDGVLASRRQAVHAARVAAQTEADRGRQRIHELIVDAIQEGVHIHTPDGRVVDFNPASLQILGLTADEVIGRAHTDPRWRVFQADGTEFPPEQYPVARTLRTGESVQNMPMGVELPNGDVRWIAVNSVPLRDPATGAVKYAVVTMNDITALRGAEVRLNDQNASLAAALEEAERANRVKSDFMGVMSHELRTPMNAIMSCALLLAQSKLDPIQRRTLGVLEDASKQMLAVLNDLLDLSTLNAGKVRIERAPVSILRLMEDAAVIWAADIRAKGLSLSVIIDPALAPARSADSARLLQVVGNLVANAVKFTQSGGVSLQAWPERGADGVQRVAIEVEDTGPGVPPDAVARIFEPFEQLDVTARRRHGGLGLGLHIARRLAIAMGGDIELETRMGQGSRFTVRVEAPEVAEAGEAAVPVAGEETPGLASREILCVDDNPRNLYVLGALLRAAGHRTTECASGAEALELMAQRKFDVILLDMVMPEMDGLDVIARLRAGGGVNVATPVIACTANVLPTQIETYRKAGTAAVLAKPIDLRAMLAAVAAAA